MPHEGYPPLKPAVDLARRVAEWLPLAALLVALWFFVFTLHPLSGDESYYIPAASQLLAGANPALVNGEHPPLAKYLIGLSMIVTRGNPRVVGGILASVSFILLYRFLRRAEGRVVAAAAAILLAVNPLFLESMGEATLEPFWISFVLLGVTIVVGKQQARFSLLAGGLLFGCAVASKVTAAPFVLAVAAYPLVVGRSWRTFGRVLACFFLPIVVVYLAAHSVAIVDLGPAGFLNYQLWVVNFHETGQGAGIIYSVAFRVFEAPVMAFLGFMNYLFVANYVPHVSLFNTYWRPNAFLNPGLWVLTIPVLGLTVSRLRKRRSVDDLFWLLMFVAGLSVTWISPKFFYFYFDGISIPLAVLAAKSVPRRLLPACLVFAAATVLLFSLPALGLGGPYQLLRALGPPA